MKKKYSLMALAAVTVLIPLLTLVAYAADPNFGNNQFRNLWVTQDRLVGTAGVSRPFTWGPSIPDAPNAMFEPYAESPGGQRQVQYFDKARMELNNPATGIVTAGLVVRDLVAGLRQDGDNTFANFPPSKTQVAGDAVSVNPNAPVYASFKNVVTLGNPDANSKPSAIGTTITSAIDKSGTVSTITPPENLTIGAFQAETGHNIAKVFADFENQTGPTTDPVSGNTIQNQAIYGANPAIQVFGFAITDPYWVNTKVAGVDRTVLVQLFQRRVLTYNPALPAGSRVEMGNVGQHYYQWRYVENSGVSPTTPTPTTPPTNTNAPLDFSQYRADYLKTGNVPLGNPGGTGNVISYSTGAGSISSSPIYDPSMHYAIIGTSGGGVVAVNTTNFSSPVQAWRYQPASVNFKNPLTLYNGIIYVGGGDGKVYAIKEADGTAAWTTPYAVPGGALPGPITVDTNSAYFTASDGKLYAINLSNGAPKWQNQPSGINLTNNFAPVDVNNTLYVAGSDNKLYAFTTDGALVTSPTWSPPTFDAAVVARPSYGNSRLYVVTLGGTLYSLNSNGTIQSSQNFGGAIYSTPAIYTVSGQPRIYFGVDTGKVYGVNANDVTQPAIWTYTVSGAPAVRSSVAIVDGFVYFAAEDKNIYKVEAANQANASTLATATAAFGTNSPIVNSGYLVIATNAGTLHVVK
jgi:outer membrane protein assembly factor BamB